MSIDSDNSEHRVASTTTLHVIADTREHLPYTFSDHDDIHVTVDTLDTADYSLVGLTDHVAIERKSLSDFLGCVGKDRDRFKRQLCRMRGYRYAVVIVESSYAEIATGAWIRAGGSRSLQQSHVFGALTSWSARYGTSFMLCGDRRGGEEFTVRYLRSVHRQVLEFCKAVGCCGA